MLLALQTFWFTISFALIFSLTSARHSHAQGIEFEQGSWEEVLALARKTDKPVFVDAYASWCGPCKKMSRRVFTQPEVGGYFNKKFVSIKLNMEKAEARTFRKQHPVNAYPTLFFIQPDGEVILRKTGYQNGKQMLRLARYVVNPEDTRVHALRKAYKKGRKDTAFLYAYILALNEVGQNVQAPLEDYWQRVEASAIADRRAFSLFYAFEHDLDARPTQYFIEHYDAMQQELGQYAGKKASTLLQKNFERAAQQRDDALIARLKKLADVFYNTKQANQVKNKISRAYTQ